MHTITSYLTSDHKRCDDVFVALEQSVSSGKWQQAETLLQQFTDALEQHFAMEETVLFPAFEKGIGSTAGPTAVMRAEHKQMDELMRTLRAALTVRDTASFLGNSETLNIMIQQHNAKEEGMLYVMADRVLSEQKQEIIAAMQELAGAI
jgi:hemerythrin-like domain-containing protein